MAYHNSVTLVGNATKAPESHAGETSGTPYTIFDLAVKHYKAPKATFIRIVVFGPQQESVLKYVKRGRLLLINGRLDVSDKGYASVVVNQVEFLGPPPEKKEPKGMGKMRQAATTIKKKKKS